jgi:hypothetical protein
MKIADVCTGEPLIQRSVIKHENMKRQWTNHDYREGTILITSSVLLNCFRIQNILSKKKKQDFSSATRISRPASPFRRSRRPVLSIFVSLDVYLCLEFGTLWDVQPDERKFMYGWIRKSFSNKVYAINFTEINLRRQEKWWGQCLILERILGIS